MRIGEVAKSAGVHVETIRYYVRRGLLQEPTRVSPAPRAYSGDAIRRVRFIRRAKELGFTLNEIKELLSLRATPRAKCADVRLRAEGKIRDVEARIRSLVAMKRALSMLTAACSGNGPVAECPILESLDEEAKI